MGMIGSRRIVPFAEGVILVLGSAEREQAMDPVTLIVAFVMGFVFFGLIGRAGRKRP